MTSRDVRDRTLASTLFHLLSEDVWDDLRARMEERTYAPGDAVIQQGELEPDFWSVHFDAVIPSAR